MLLHSLQLLWLQIFDQSAKALETIWEQVVNYLPVVRYKVALIELELAILVELSKNDK